MGDRNWDTETRVHTEFAFVSHVYMPGMGSFTKIKCKQSAAPPLQPVQIEVVHAGLANSLGGVCELIGSRIVHAMLYEII